jgi:hypothetical protein
MCMTCGCTQPNDDHGDPRNITQQSLTQAAQASGISPQQAAQNSMDACQQLEFNPAASHTQLSQQPGGWSPLAEGRPLEQSC